MKGTISGASVANAVVHQFTEYAAINFMDETDVSQDGAHVVVIGGDNSGSSPENVFVYDLVTNRKGAVYTTSCRGVINNVNDGCLHKLIQTPDNNVIIQFTGDGTGPEQGNRLWSGLTPLLQLQDSTDHLDTGYDLNGNRTSKNTNGAVDYYGYRPGPDYGYPDERYAPPAPVYRQDGYREGYQQDYGYAPAFLPVQEVYAKLPETKRKGIETRDRTR